MLAGFILLGAPAVARGQSQFGQIPPHVLAPGARVRLTRADGAVVGTVLTVSADTIALQPGAGAGADRRPIAIGSIRKLEVGQGMRGRAGNGFVIGFIGAAVWFAVTCRGEDLCTPESSAGDHTLEYSAIVGLGGGLLGAIIGSFVKHEVWQEQNVPRAGLHTGITLLPGGRAGFGLSLVH
jgi:hypothetical protein